MKYYSLPIALLIVGIIVLGMGILYLSHAIKFKNIHSKSSKYLIPNITYLSLAIVWLFLGAYLAVIVKLQLL